LNYIALIGEALGSIAKSVGYSTYNSKLGATFDTLMKDESADVRLGVAKSLYDIFISSDQSLLSSASTIFGAFQKDNQYKIREKIIVTIAKLGVAYGLDVFKANLESLYFVYLTDPVSSVREQGISQLEGLTAKFGQTWTVNNLIPKLSNYLTQSKTSYLHRIVVLSSIAICAKNLNANQINENIIPVLLKNLKDKIPNVRFFLIKSLSNILPYTDNAGKEKIKV
jgi:hypothetical protein